MSQVESNEMPPNRIHLGLEKVSGGMRQVLEELMDSLQCPLCQQIFERPTTLASCGHSFCETCIDDYNANSDVCPVDGCRMPMSIVGGRRGSYRNVNPQLAQSVESLRLICQGLNRAPDQWWKQNRLRVTKKEPEDEDEEDMDGPDFMNAGLGSQSDSDDENLIELPIGP